MLSLSYMEYWQIRCKYSTIIARYSHQGWAFRLIQINNGIEENMHSYNLICSTPLRKSLVLVNDRYRSCHRLIQMIWFATDMRYSYRGFVFCYIYPILFRVPHFDDNNSHRFPLKKVCLIKITVPSAVRI